MGLSNACRREILTDHEGIDFAVILMIAFSCDKPVEEVEFK
jgi:hypothetical protein